MNICILGFGNVGSRLAHLWSEAGHTLSVGLRSNSKHGDAARKAGLTVSEPHIAVQSADIVALAVPWEAVKGALSNAGPLDGKILIDATNPLDSDLRVLTPKEGSSAQQIVAWFPGARLAVCRRETAKLLHCGGRRAAVAFSERNSMDGA
jgi:8-hydroxy-5-deazaflavin:NADPH oxidoreductase